MVPRHAHEGRKVGSNCVQVQQDFHGQHLPRLVLVLTVWEAVHSDQKLDKAAR
jgi:hypothetical protein